MTPLFLPPVGGQNAIMTEAETWGLRRRGFRVEGLGVRVLGVLLLIFLVVVVVVVVVTAVAVLVVEVVVVVVVVVVVIVVVVVVVASSETPRNSLAAGLGSGRFSQSRRRFGAEGRLVLLVTARGYLGFRV